MLDASFIRESYFLRRRWPRLRKSVLHGLTRSLGLNSTDQTVVVVSGVPRSGTTLILELIDLDPSADVFHEDDRRLFERYHLKDWETLERLLGQPKTSLTALKLLFDVDKLGLLLRSFPNLKVLWIFRRFENVVLSNMKKFPGGRNKIDQIVNDAEFKDWRSAEMSGSTKELIRSHYRPGISNATAQALFWFQRNQLYFDQKLDRSDRVSTLNYDALVADPIAQTEKLGSWLGIKHEPRMPRLIKRGSPKPEVSVDIDPEVRKVCEHMLARLHNSPSCLRTESGH